jgi:uncharacterized protein (DUF58 family)
VSSQRSTSEILSRIRRLEIRTRRIVETAFAGQYQSVFKGRGMNFDEVRPYQIGDEIRNIEWNVTARMGEPFVKKYVEERELTILLLLDLSESGGFGSRNLSKRELAAEVAALLAYCALRNNDKAGSLFFTDRVEHYVPPRKGNTHVLRLIRDLLYFEPQNKGTDLSSGLDFLTNVLRRRAIIFLFSDFRTAKNYERALAICAKKHDLVAVPVEDPAEMALPSIGLVQVEDPETGQTRLVDFSSRKARTEFAQLNDQWKTTRDAIFQRHGVETIQLSTDLDYLPVVHDFFRRRQARLRSL